MNKRNLNCGYQAVNNSSLSSTANVRMIHFERLRVKTLTQVWPCIRSASKAADFLQCSLFQKVNTT